LHGAGVVPKNGGKHLNDVIRGAFAVDLLGLCGWAIRGDQNFQVLRGGRQLGVQIGNLPCGDSDVLSECGESDVANGYRVRALSQPGNKKISLRVRYRANTAGLYRDSCALQDAPALIG